MYFCYFINISPGIKVGPFIWTNLSPHHPRMHCAKFGWNWLSGSGEEDFLISSMYFCYFINISPWKGRALHLNKRETPSPKGALCQVWLKLAHAVVLERKIFLISSMYFCYFVIISPWKRAGPLIWTKLNPLHSRMLCAFGLNWPSGSWEEVENRKSLQTDRRTDRQTTEDRRSEKLTWAFSSGELKQLMGTRH